MAIKGFTSLAPGAKQGLQALLDTWAQKYVVAPRSAAQGTGDGVTPPNTTTKTQQTKPFYPTNQGDMYRWQKENQAAAGVVQYPDQATPSQKAVAAQAQQQQTTPTAPKQPAAINVPSKEQFAKMYPTADPSEYNQFVQNFQQDLARRNQTIKLADGTTQKRIPVGADGMNMQRIVENDAAGNPQLVYRDASMTTRPAVDANGNLSRNYAPPAQGMNAYRITQDQLNQLIYAARSGALDEFYPEMIDQINGTKK